MMNEIALLVNCIGFHKRGTLIVLIAIAPDIVLI